MTLITAGIRALWIILVAKSPGDVPVPPPNSDVLASTAIERGIVHMRHDEYEDALREFLAARALAPSPRATAEVGLAEHALGRLPAAERHLTEALSATDDRWVRSRRRDLEASLNEVASHLGSLDVQGFPPGAEIRIEGQLVGALPLRRPLRWPRGGAAVEVSAAGFQPFSKVVDVQPGQLVPLWAELRDLRGPAPALAAAALPIAPPEAPASPEIPSSALRWVSWSSVVVGVVAAGLGSVLWTTGHDKFGAGLVAGGTGAAIVGVVGLGLDGFPDQAGKPALQAHGLAAPLVTF